MNWFWILLVISCCLSCGHCSKKYSSQNSESLEDEACNDSVEIRDNSCDGENELWLPCGKFKNCEPTCGKLYEPCNRKYIQCPKGCQCDDEFARDPETGDCIPEEKCEDFISCPKNEEYKKSALKCEESCDANLCSKIDPVPEEGCFCKAGFARIGLECVSRKKCKCPKHMEWNDCGSPCTDHCDKGLVFCKGPCSPRCYCSDGYARINDTCLSEDLCEHNCGDNEIYKKCGNSCQDYCDSACEDGECSPGCYCLPGFKREGLYQPCELKECGKMPPLDLSLKL